MFGYENTDRYLREKTWGCIWFPILISRKLTFKLMVAKKNQKTVFFNTDNSSTSAEVMSCCVPFFSTHTSDVKNLHQKESHKESIIILRL